METFLPQPTSLVAPSPSHQRRMNKLIVACTLDTEYTGNKKISPKKKDVQKVSIQTNRQSNISQLTRKQLTHRNITPSTENAAKNSSIRAPTSKQSSNGGSAGHTSLSRGVQSPDIARPVNAIKGFHTTNRDRPGTQKQPQSQSVDINQSIRKGREGEDSYSTRKSYTSPYAFTQVKRTRSNQRINPANPNNDISEAYRKWRAEQAAQVASLNNKRQKPLTPTNPIPKSNTPTSINSPSVLTFSALPNSTSPPAIASYGHINVSHLPLPSAPLNFSEHADNRVSPSSAFQRSTAAIPATPTHITFASALDPPHLHDQPPQSRNHLEQNIDSISTPYRVKSLSPVDSPMQPYHSRSVSDHKRKEELSAMSRLLHSAQTLHERVADLSTTSSVVTRSEADIDIQNWLRLKMEQRLKRSNPPRHTIDSTPKANWASTLSTQHTSVAEIGTETDFPRTPPTIVQYQAPIALPHPLTTTGQQTENSIEPSIAISDSMTPSKQHEAHTPMPDIAPIPSRYSAPAAVLDKSKMRSEAASVQPFQHDRNETLDLSSHPIKVLDVQPLSPRWRVPRTMGDEAWFSVLSRGESLAAELSTLEQRSRRPKDFTPPHPDTPIDLYTFTETLEEREAQHRISLRKAERLLDAKKPNKVKSHKAEERLLHSEEKILARTPITKTNREAVIERAPNQRSESPNSSHVSKSTTPMMPSETPIIVESKESSVTSADDLSSLPAFEEDLPTIIGKMRDIFRAEMRSEQADRDSGGRDDAKRTDMGIPPILSAIRNVYKEDRQLHISPDDPMLHKPMISPALDAAITQKTLRQQTASFQTQLSSESSSLGTSDEVAGNRADKLYDEVEIANYQTALREVDDYVSDSRISVEQVSERPAFRAMNEVEPLINRSISEPTSTLSEATRDSVALGIDQQHEVAGRSKDVHDLSTDIEAVDSLDRIADAPHSLDTPTSDQRSDADNFHQIQHSPQSELDVNPVTSTVDLEEGGSQLRNTTSVRSEMRAMSSNHSISEDVRDQETSEQGGSSADHSGVRTSPSVDATHLAAIPSTENAARPTISPSSSLHDLSEIGEVKEKTGFESTVHGSSLSSVNESPLAHSNAYSPESSSEAEVSEHIAPIISASHSGTITESLPESVDDETLRSRLHSEMSVCEGQSDIVDEIEDDSPDKEVSEGSIADNVDQAEISDLDGAIVAFVTEFNIRDENRSQSQSPDDTSKTGSLTSLSHSHASDPDHARQLEDVPVHLDNTEAPPETIVEKAYNIHWPSTEEQHPPTLSAGLATTDCEAIVELMFDELIGNAIEDGIAEQVERSREIHLASPASTVNQPRPDKTTNMLPKSTIRRIDVTPVAALSLCDELLSLVQIPDDAREVADNFVFIDVEALISLYPSSNYLAEQLSYDSMILDAVNEACASAINENAKKTLQLPSTFIRRNIKARLKEWASSSFELIGADRNPNDRARRSIQRIINNINRNSTVKERCGTIVDELCADLWDEIVQVEIGCLS